LLGSHFSASDGQVVQVLAGRGRLAADLIQGVWQQQSHGPSSSTATSSMQSQLVSTLLHCCDQG
jgi:hypothetical protein